MRRYAPVTPLTRTLALYVISVNDHIVVTARQRGPALPSQAAPGAPTGSPRGRDHGRPRTKRETTYFPRMASCYHIYIATVMRTISRKEFP
jgi:hypothetical protein